MCQLKLFLVLLVMKVAFPNFVNLQETKEHKHKSFGEPCLQRHECNYKANLHCFERHCGCYTRVTHKLPGGHFLAMEWESEQESCFSVLNSICMGTNETEPPPKKIHAKCLLGLECIQQTDLELGIGTCQLSRATTEQVNSSENVELDESNQVISGLDTDTEESPTYSNNISRKSELFIPCPTNSAMKIIGSIWYLGAVLTLLKNGASL